MRLALVCFYCLCVLFMFSILSRRCALLATSLSVLFCLLSMLISDSRFDLVWFRLSCDHGWIRSGSVNVRKQQQLYKVYIRSNLRIIKRAFICRSFSYYVDILLLLHGLRAVHGLVHVATAVQGLVNCAVKARCQRIAVVAG